MANLNFDFDESFEKQMAMLDNFDEIAEKMIEESLPILEQNVKSECNNHSQTHEMVDSIKPTKVKKCKDGWYSIVKPTGKDKKGVRNMEKLAYLEYGTSKQIATPTLSVAVKKSTPIIAEKMQEIYNREVSK